MSPFLSLSCTSDSELAAVMGAARPIPRRDREAFLVDVASELANYPELGPGIVGRVVGKLQREHLTRPRYRNGVTKWR
jgi:hypothetical protein